MKLSRVNYRSAIFFGIFAFVAYLLLGIFNLVLISFYDEIATMIEITPLQALVIGPIIGGISVFVFVLFAIFVYNQIARKFPISWEIKK